MSAVLHVTHAVIRTTLSRRIVAREVNAFRARRDRLLNRPSSTVLRIIDQPPTSHCKSHGK